MTGLFGRLIDWLVESSGCHRSLLLLFSLCLSLQSTPPPPVFLSPSDAARYKAQAIKGEVESRVIITAKETALKKQQDDEQSRMMTVRGERMSHDDDELERG